MKEILQLEENLPYANVIIDKLNEVIAVVNDLSVQLDKLEKGLSALKKETRNVVAKNIRYS